MEVIKQIASKLISKGWKIRSTRVSSHGVITKGFLIGSTTLQKKVAAGYDVFVVLKPMLSVDDFITISVGGYTPKLRDTYIVSQEEAQDISGVVKKIEGNPRINVRSI